MRKIVYSCDFCEKEIGDKNHISFELNNHAKVGVAVPPNPESNESWGIHLKMKDHTQYCNGTCAGEHLNKLMKEVNK